MTINHSFQPTVTTFTLRLRNSHEKSQRTVTSRAIFFIKVTYDGIWDGKNHENFLFGGRIFNIRKATIIAYYAIITFNQRSVTWRGYKMLWRVNVTFNLHLQKLKGVVFQKSPEKPLQTQISDSILIRNETLHQIPFASDSIYSFVYSEFVPDVSGEEIRHFPFKERV